MQVSMAFRRGLLKIVRSAVDPAPDHKPPLNWAFARGAQSVELSMALVADDGAFH
jgi:hypothetical protein